MSAIPLRATALISLMIVPAALNAQAEPEAPDYLLFTRQAEIPLPAGGRLSVDLPNFVPPEALPRGSTISLHGERETVVQFNHGLLGQHGSRVRIYESILKNLWLRTDDAASREILEHGTELKRAADVAGGGGSLATALRRATPGAHTRISTELPTALNAVAVILSAAGGAAEGEAEALLVYAGSSASYEVRRQVFSELLAEGSFVDPALAEAVENVIDEVARARERDLSAMRRAYQMRAGAEAGAESLVQVLSSSLIGSGAILALGGTLGVAGAAVLPAAMFYSLSRMGNRLEVEATLVLGATLERRVFRPFLGSPAARDPEVRLRALEMRDELLSTLSDAALAYGGDPDPETRAAGLLDPNFSSQTERLYGRDYRERAQLFRGSIHLPSPERLPLYQTVAWDILFGPSPASAEDRAARGLLFVLDLSGSMRGQRLEDLRASVLETLKEADPTVDIGILAFGGQPGCHVELAVPFTGDRSRIAEYVSQVEAVGMTPLAGALMAAAEIIRSPRSPREVTLVLHSDGMETCRGDPEAAAATLRRLQGSR